MDFMGCNLWAAFSVLVLTASLAFICFPAFSEAMGLYWFATAVLAGGLAFIYVPSFTELVVWLYVMVLEASWHAAMMVIAGVVAAAILVLDIGILVLPFALLLIVTLALIKLIMPQIGAAA